MKKAYEEGNVARDAGGAIGVAVLRVTTGSNVTHNVFFNNTGNWIVNNANNINLEYNWWGSNTPGLGSLVYGTVPKTWVVMNFTNIQPINSLTSSVILLTTLDTFYNSSSGTYGKLTNVIPYRTVVYNYTSSALVSPNINSILVNDTPTLTYPSGISYLQVNSTIDKQVLSIGTSDMEIKINVSNPNPSLLGVIEYVITVKNNGPDTARDVFVSFPAPNYLS